MQNNPIRYNDPTGHRPECGVYSECRTISKKPKSSSLILFRNDPGQIWTEREKDVLNANAQAVANALARAMNQESRLLRNAGEADGISRTDPAKAFYEAFNGPVVARRSSYNCDGCWAENIGYIDGYYEIWVYSNTSSNDIINHPNLFTHELGHAFLSANHINRYTVVPDELWRPLGADGRIQGTQWINGRVDYYGYAGGHYVWQFGKHPANRSGEEFADMFVAWTYSSWGAPDPVTGINEKQSFMHALMPNLIP